MQYLEVTQDDEFLFKSKGKGFCGDGMFVCLSKSNQCIAQRYLCDGLADCDDGADESKEVCGNLKQFRKNFL